MDKLSDAPCQSGRSLPVTMAMFLRDGFGCHDHDMLLLLLIIFTPLCTERNLVWDALWLIHSPLVSVLLDLKFCHYRSLLDTTLLKGSNHLAQPFHRSTIIHISADCYHVKLTPYSHSLLDELLRKYIPNPQLCPQSQSRGSTEGIK